MWIFWWDPCWKSKHNPYALGPLGWSPKPAPSLVPCLLSQNPVTSCPVIRSKAGGSCRWLGTGRDEVLGHKGETLGTEKVSPLPLPCRVRYCKSPSHPPQGWGNCVSSLPSTLWRTDPQFLENSLLSLLVTSPRLHQLALHEPSPLAASFLARPPIEHGPLSLGGHRTECLPLLGLIRRSRVYLIIVLNSASWAAMENFHSFPESGQKLFTQPQLILGNINPVVFTGQERLLSRTQVKGLPSFTHIACWPWSFVKFLNCPRGDEPSKFSWKDLVQIVTI